MKNGKILATGDLKSGEVTKHGAAEVSSPAGDMPQMEPSPLKKKLLEFGFVEQEFPADGSYSFSNRNLVN